MKEFVKITYLGEDISYSVENYRIEPLIHGINCTRLDDNIYMIPPTNVKLFLHNGDIIETNTNDCEITVFINEEGD